MSDPVLSCSFPRGESALQKGLRYHGVDPMAELIFINQGVKGVQDVKLQAY